VEVQEFELIDEAAPIVCSENSFAPFSLPAEAFSFQPKPEQVVCVYRSGDRERRIHSNIELTTVEQEHLTALQTEAWKEGAKFYPSVSCNATRFISRARGDPKKALKLMQATQEWRQTYFKAGPIRDEDIREDLEYGIVYFTGRDSHLRPSIVVRACRIPPQWWKEKRVDKLMRILIYCMEYFVRYMVVPGRVENLSVIADMKGVGFAQCNLSFLSEINSVLSHHYLGRVCYFYVLNMPASLRMLATAVKKLLTDRQQQKIQILDDPSKLRKDFALHQLEEDMGGSRPIVTKPIPFPLQPGPFESNYAGGPDLNECPGMHKVLSDKGARGRIWDPSKSEEANQELEYSEEGPHLLQKSSTTATTATGTLLQKSCTTATTTTARLPEEEKGLTARPPRGWTGAVPLREREESDGAASPPYEEELLEFPVLLGSGAMSGVNMSKDVDSYENSAPEGCLSPVNKKQVAIDFESPRNCVSPNSQRRRWEGHMLFFGCCRGSR
jgi:hypothetical protein